MTLATQAWTFQVRRESRVDRDSKVTLDPQVTQAQLGNQAEMAHQGYKVPREKWGSWVPLGAKVSRVLQEVPDSLVLKVIRVWPVCQDTLEEKVRKV